MVPTVLLEDYACAKALRDLIYFVNTFLPVANDITDSRFTNMTSVRFRSAFMRAETLDLLIAVKSMLLVAVRVKNLLVANKSFLNGFETALDAIPKVGTSNVSQKVSTFFLNSSAGIGSDFATNFNIEPFNEIDW